MSLTEKLNTLFEEVWARKVPFFAVFFVVTLITYAILFVIDFIPEAPAEDENTEAASALTEPAEIVHVEKGFEEKLDPLPLKIIIDELDREVEVLNPESSSIADLDEALLSGVVRHPDSSDFDQEGNMFLFGHSSYLPTIHNRNFQAFNGIQDLKWGDTIRVQSSDTEYIYQVNDVYEVLASAASVSIDHSAPKLTLATCDSFGSKDDRFIVEAELIGKRPL